MEAETKYFNPLAQRQYCCITTLLSSDDAINEGIVTKQNSIRLLYFFINAGNDKTIARWLTQSDGQLITKRLLQLVNLLYIKNEMCVMTKSSLVEYLMNRSEIELGKTSRSIQASMCGTIPTFVSRQILRVLNR